MPTDLLWPYGDLSATVLAGLGLLALVVLAGELRRRGVSGQATRALVHAGTGLATAAMPWGFNASAGPVGLALAFAALNAWALRQGRLRGLHDRSDGPTAPERPRRSVGTVAFPLALVAGVAVADPFTGDASGRIVWAVAFAVLALADPIAAAVGRAWTARVGRAGRTVAPSKTAAGSLAFAGVAALVATAVLRGLTPWSGGEIAAFAAAVALVGAACERAGQGGWDNLWIALGLLVLGSAWTPDPAVWTLPGVGAHGWTWAVDGRLHAAAALVVGAVVAGASRRARFLTADGALAAGLLAATLVALGTWAHAASGAVFFVASSLLSKVGTARAVALDAVSEKGSVRDAGQVLANGGVAWACLLVDPDGALGLWGWIGAFAAAAADTWATEVGTLAGQTPRLVTTLRPVSPGTSGGVTLAGTLGAAAGALAVGIAAGLVGARGAGGVGIGAAAPLALAAGLAGAFADSALGATLQARYRRPDGRRTERAVDAGQANVRDGGLVWLTNDRVNLACTLVGALVGWAMGG